MFRFTARPRARRHPIAGLSLVAVLALGACNGDDGTDPESVITTPTTDVESTTTTGDVTTTTAATTTTTEMSVEAEVEALARGEFEAFAEILGAPDPAHPLIDEIYVGAARDQILDLVTERILAGEVTSRPADDDNYRLEEVDVRIDSATKASASVCAIDGLFRQNLTTGEVSNTAVGTVRRELAASKTPAGWRVQEVLLVSVEEGVRTCSSQG